MNHTILYIGLDVDDTRYHGCALSKHTGETIDFQCRPTLKGLLAQLNKVARHFPGHSLRLCYEASYIGYCLQRDLTDKRFHCDVVAPTSIPTPRGRAIKTDRIDAGQLAQFYASNLLTIVQPPDVQQEQDRDLLRTRQNLRKDKAHITCQSSCVLRITSEPCRPSRQPAT